jgi:hypothetical protein
MASAPDEILEFLEITTHAILHARQVYPDGSRPRPARVRREAHRVRQTLRSESGWRMSGRGGRALRAPAEAQRAGAHRAARTAEKLHRGAAFGRRGSPLLARPGTCCSTRRPPPARCCAAVMHRCACRGWSRRWRW